MDSGIAQIQTLMPGLTAEQALQSLVAAGQDQAEAYASAKPKLVLMEQVYAAVTGGVDRPMDKAGFFTAMLMLSDITKLPADQQTPENIAGILSKNALYAEKGKLLSHLLNSEHDTAKLTGLLERLGSLLNHLGSGGLTGDLSGLVGKTDITLGHLDSLADVGREILIQVDDLLLMDAGAPAVSLTSEENPAPVSGSSAPRRSKRRARTRRLPPALWRRRPPSGAG